MCSVSANQSANSCKIEKDKDKTALVCETCLSSGRRLAPLGSLQNLFVSLMDRDISVDIWICWECTATLRRTAQFRLRVARAQAWLNSTQYSNWDRREAKPISSLRPTGTMLEVEINSELISHAASEEKTEEYRYSDDEQGSNWEQYSKNIFEHKNCKVEIDLKVESTPTITSIVKNESKHINSVVKHDEQKRGRRRLRTKISRVTEHTQEDKENYECDKCGKKCISRIKMKQHLQCHGEELYECSACGRGFKRKAYLNVHYRLKHVVAPVLSEAYCVECNKQFTTTKSYKMHLASVHTEKSDIKIPCTACDKTFANTRRLKNHYDFIHLKKTKFFCDICNKNYSKKFALQYHMKRFHEGIPLPKNQACNICNREFSTKKTLVHHIRTHTGERPHKCDYCSAAFTQPSAKRSHIKHVHQGVKHLSSHICNICGKGLTTRRSLVQHIRTHTGERPHKCEYCNAAFNQLDGMKKHVKKVHLRAGRI